MAAEENTNWSQSVTGIVIREGKVLLARHTYGPGKGKLIVPGGYVKWQESPQEALKREYAIKQLSRKEKLALIKAYTHT